jgi:hypothetical protein
MNNYQSQVARGTPFDPTNTGFTSINVQDAIVESYNTAIEKARFALPAAFDANANTGRWLEWFKSVDSQTSPFVMPRDSQVAELSLSNANTTATATVSLFKNGVFIQSISLAAEQYTTITGLSVMFNAGDELSIQVTSGTLTRPIIFVFVEIL